MGAAVTKLRRILLLRLKEQLLSFNFGAMLCLEVQASAFEQ